MSAKIKNWEEISRESVFQKYGRGVEKVIFKLPDGKQNDFYIKKEGVRYAFLRHLVHSMN